MTKLDIDDETYQFFVQETLELLQCLESGLLTLRQEHSINKIHSLMRIAHSIKGGTACVGLTGIQTLAHQLENTFKVLYQENIEVDQELEELLLQAYDSLRSPLLDQIQTGKCDTDAHQEKLKQICDQIEANLGYNLSEETDSKEAETDEDIAQVLFAEEVARGLECWEMLLTNSQMPELVEKLKIQAEVFASIGQFLNLPAFVAIAQTTISALQLNPLAVKTIGKPCRKRLSSNSNLSFKRIEKSLNIKPCSQLVNLAKFESQNAKDVKQDVPPEAEKEPNPKLGVRVDLERLELLNNLVGDLVTQESSFILQQQQQKEIVETISQRLNRLTKLTRKYLSKGADKASSITHCFSHIQ
ncbi:MAG TPA: hypothetical protein DD990_03300 [Cyanobacteria bacterium UBA11368]|nr:hypothetical protein [Cyanobacteria bacterium UBA11368]